MSLDLVDDARAVVRERVAMLGAEENLVAIVSEPPDPRPLPRILILNAGVLHRIGPHRLHVRLARRLAAIGHAVARIDLSGIGDSRPLPGRMTFRESSVADVRMAMDTLVAEAPAPGAAADRFVLFGICSGADNALAAAEADPRVAALVLVDPPAYASRQSRLRQLSDKAKGDAGWLALPLRAARAALRRVGSHPVAHEADEPLNEGAGGAREMPPIDRYGAQLQGLLARGVRILAIYSGVMGVRYNDADQLFEWFPELRGKLDIAYFPHANHTFTELSAQEQLESRVLAWMGKNAGEG